MKVIGGPSSLKLAEKISNLMNVSLLPIATKRFPDNEFYLRFKEKVDNEDVLIVQSLYPPQDSHLLELFMLLHTARDSGSKNIKVFIPYLAYSRQDERYLKGECLSSAMIAEVLEKLGLDSLYTIDIHNKNVLGMYSPETYNLTASEEIATYLSKKDPKNPLVISPDDEEMAVLRAEKAANVIGADYNFFRKKRDKHTGNVTTYSKKIDAKGRDIILIDDIISTGNTAANATRILKKQGARKIFLGVSHALLLDDATNKLFESGVDEIVGTDSVENVFAKVSVAPILKKALK